MRHVQALLNWILLSTGRTDLKRLVVVVVDETIMMMMLNNHLNQDTQHN